MNYKVILANGRVIGGLSVTGADKVSSMHPGSRVEKDSGSDTDLPQSPPPGIEDDEFFSAIY